MECLTERAHLAGGTLDARRVTDATGMTLQEGLPAGIVRRRRRRDDRLAEERLDALLHYAEDAVVVVDGRGVIRRANELTSHVLGHEPDRLVGQHLAVLLPERSRAVHEHHVATFVSSERRELRMANRRPVTARRADGHEVPVTVSISAFEHRGEQLHIAVVRDASERAELEQAVSWLSTHDQLTGLPTTSAVLERMAEDRRRRPSVPVAVVAIDLAELGTVNDALGRPAGDRVLATVAERLAALAARAGGHAGRLGGDRFVLVVPGIAYGPAAAAVGLEVAVQVGAPVRVDDEPLRVRLWQGARIWDGDGPPDADAVLRDALAALAQARSVRSRTLVLHDGATSAARRARRRLAIDLRGAIDAGALRLAYQPLVEVDSGRPVAAEALLRWDHPELGPISPEHFIGIAEEDDELIDALWCWTVRAACDQVGAWRSAGDVPVDFRVSVNVSARQLRSPEVVEHLRRALADTSLDPAMLCVEVTETAAMEDLDLGADVLGSMRELGVAVALDDFGTGYSSLARLGHLPIDEIKLDGSLIRDIVRDVRSVAVVSALLSVSKVFGIGVVAECVETDAQLGVLAELGCPVVQGWYFAPAEPPERFLATRAELDGPRRTGLGTRREPALPSVR